MDEEEEIYKEEVEVSIVGSLSLWWLLRQVLMSLCAGPMISSFVQKCAKILTLLTVLGTVHCIHLDQKLIMYFQ